MNAKQRRKYRRWYERFRANAREVARLWAIKDESDRELYGMMDAMRAGRK